MWAILLNIFKVCVFIYVLILVLLYFFQEKLIFHPSKIPNDYQFNFLPKPEELTFKTQDNILLHGILMKADSSKGLIFYLHGNGGTVASWGEIAHTYTTENYDVFMLDYRGYGKSGGSIFSEKQLHEDVQLVYNKLKERYSEDKIIILGYSMGSGMATKLATKSNAKLLILQAPYYSLKDLMSHYIAFIPTFILKYSLETNKVLPQCKMPVIIFHGTKDEVIYYESSLKLQKLFKEKDTLILLNGQYHNNMSENPQYLKEIEKILRK